jgi:hypothetical protein
MDTAAVDEALEADPANAELKLDGARYFLVCARTSGDESFQRNATDRVFELLRGAIARGLTRRHLVELARIEPKLQGDPRWQVLEAYPPSDVPFERAVLVHDPLNDLTRPQTPAARGPTASRELPGLSAVASP